MSSLSFSYQAPGSRCSLASPILELLYEFILGSIVLVCAAGYVWLDPQAAYEIRKRFRETHHLTLWKACPLPFIWAAVRYCVYEQSWKAHLSLIVLCLAYLALFYITELKSYSHHGDNPLAWTWWRTLYRVILPLLLLADWHFRWTYPISAVSLLAALALSTRPVWSSLVIGLVLLPPFYAPALAAAALSILGHSFAYPILIFVYTLIRDFGASNLEYASRQLALGWLAAGGVLLIHFIASVVTYTAHDFFLHIVPMCEDLYERATSNTLPNKVKTSRAALIKKYSVVLGMASERSCDFTSFWKQLDSKLLTQFECFPTAENLLYALRRDYDLNACKGLTNVRRRPLPPPMVRRKMAVLFATFLLSILFLVSATWSFSYPCYILPKQHLEPAKYSSAMVHAAKMSHLVYGSNHAAFNDTEGKQWVLKGRHEDAALGAKFIVYHHPDTNTAWVAFRGTSLLQDWTHGNLAFFLMDASDSSLSADGAHHAGFEENFVALKSELEPVLQQLPKDCSIILTGHSKGGAIAAVAMDYLMDNRTIPMQLFTFGQPVVSDAIKLDRLNRSGTYFPLVLQEANNWFSADPIPLIAYILFQLPTYLFPVQSYAVPAYYALPACSFESGLALHSVEIYDEVLSLLFFGAGKYANNTRTLGLHLSTLPPEALDSPLLTEAGTYPGHTPSAKALRTFFNCNASVSLKSQLAKEECSWWSSCVDFLLSDLPLPMT